MLIAVAGIFLGCCGP